MMAKPSRHRKTLLTLCHDTRFQGRVIRVAVRP